MTPDAAAPREEPQTEATEAADLDALDKAVAFLGHDPIGVLPSEWLRAEDQLIAAAPALIAELRALRAAASARAGAVTKFPWMMHDGHTLWRTRGTTVDAHWPDRCAKCSGVEVPAASARAGGAGIDVEYRETAERLVRDLWTWMVRSEPFISAVLVLAEDKGPGLNLITDVPDLRARVLAFLAVAAAPVSEAGRDPIPVSVQAKADHYRNLAKRTAISGEDWRFTNGYDLALKDIRAAGPRDAGE